MDLIPLLQSLLDSEGSPPGRRGAVSRVLNALGHRDLPAQRRVIFEDKPETLWVWSATPAGDLALLGDKVVPLPWITETNGVAYIYKPVETVKEEPVTLRLSDLPNDDYSFDARLQALSQDRQNMIAKALREVYLSFKERFEHESRLRNPALWLQEAD